jgi:small subunit ribosomal protein S6
MKKYEIMYILRPTLDEAARKAAIESIHKILTDNGAKITNVNEWGLRDLAYPIKKETKGYYVVIKVEADVTATSEFKRHASFNPVMLRHLITVDQD